MKKLFYFAMMAIVMLGMSACGDDEDNGSTPSTLTGTEWVVSEHESGVEEGITYTADITVTLKFKTDKDGEMVIAGSMTAEGYGSFPLDETQSFTYTYSDGSGTLTQQDEDSGELMTAPFTVSGNQLTLVDIDSETGEEMSIVFTRK